MILFTYNDSAYSISKACRRVVEPTKLLIVLKSSDVITSNLRLLSSGANTPSVANSVLKVS